MPHIIMLFSRMRVCARVNIKQGVEGLCFHGDGQYPVSDSQWILNVVSLGPTMRVVKGFKGWESEERRKDVLSR